MVQITRSAVQEGVGVIVESIERGVYARARWLKPSAEVRGGGSKNTQRQGEGLREGKGILQRNIYLSFAAPDPTITYGCG